MALRAMCKYSTLLTFSIRTHCIATAWELPSDSHIYNLFYPYRHYIAYMNTINWHILSALVTRVIISRKFL